MKKYRFNFAIVFLLLISLNIKSQSSIEEIIIPDPEFKKYCLKEFDKNQDGILSREEADKVTTIYLYSKDIASLEGLDFFPNLKQLRISSPEFSDIDISKNILLEDLHFTNSKTTKLDISNNVNLRTLSCSGSSLTELDLSKNNKLEQLYCKTSGLTKLDISNLHNLKTLACSENNLSELNITNNPKLDYLDCSKNNLTKLDLSNNPELMHLDFDNNKITSVDLSKNRKIKVLNCKNNQINALNLSNQKLLNMLRCSNNRISILDLKDKYELSYLYCDANRLTTLNLVNCNALRVISCENNKLISLTLPSLPNETNIDINYADNPNLKTIKNQPKKYTKEEVFDILTNNLKDHSVSDVTSLIPYKNGSKWGLMDKNTKRPVGKAIYQSIGFFQPKASGYFNSDFRFDINHENGKLNIQLEEIRRGVEIGVMEAPEEDRIKVISSADGYKGFEVDEKGNLSAYSDIYKAQYHHGFNVKPILYKGKYYAIATLKDTEFKSVVIDTDGNYAPNFGQIYQHVDYNYSASTADQQWFYLKEANGKSYFQDMEGNRKMENEIIKRPNSNQTADYMTLTGNGQSGVLDMRLMEWVLPPQTSVKYESLDYTSLTYYKWGKAKDRDKVTVYVWVKDANDNEYYIDLKGTKYIPTEPKKKSSKK